MLPELVLDNENFEEMMDEARNIIISLYPDWTDFNYHDPGITLIELFSWVRESQQFFLDQISSVHREKYLKLLSIVRRHKRPALAYVQVVPQEDITELEGTKLYAGQTCFETGRKKQLIKGDVAACFFAGEGISQSADKKVYFGHRLQMKLFGAAPKDGGLFYIVFLQGLPVKIEHALFLEFTGNPLMERNAAPLPMAFPFAKLAMEYYGDKGWTQAEQVRDETDGGIVTGQIYFELPDSMAETEILGERGYFLRLVLMQSSYDVPPVLQGISINVITLKQQEHVIEQQELSDSSVDLDRGSCYASTLMALNDRNDLYIRSLDRYIRVTSFTKTCNYENGLTQFDFTLPPSVSQADGIRVISHLEENVEKKLLATGSGFPFQEYDLYDHDVEYDSFGLMVQEMDTPNSYLDWKKVQDFAGSGPEDRNYILDTELGVVRFGDCIHGMAPKGHIVITNYVRTLGRQGNVKAYQIDRFDGLKPEDIKVYNVTDCYGGLDEESLDECFLRARKELKHSVTAVTDADYERLVMETPGLMIQSCKAIGAGERKPELTIVVKACSMNQEASLSQVYKDNILHYLEQYRMVGRKIHLLQPRYITFEIYGDIVVQPHFVGAREIVRNTVEAYFLEIDKEFGAVVSSNQLYGRIDMLTCVSHIHSLTVDVKGNGVIRNQDGTIKLPFDGIARLGAVQYLFSIL